MLTNEKIQRCIEACVQCTSKNANNAATPVQGNPRRRIVRGRAVTVPGYAGFVPVTPAAARSSRPI